MAKSNRPSTYLLLVYTAYGFYIALGMAWLLFGLFSKPSHINPFAFLIVLAFGIQAYMRHLVTNLVLGVIGLFFSIFMMLLPSLNLAFQPAAKGGSPLGVPLVLISLASLAFSGILIFSFLKLNFKD